MKKQKQKNYRTETAEPWQPHSVEAEVAEAVRAGMFETDTNAKPVKQEIENITNQVINRLKILNIV